MKKLIIAGVFFAFAKMVYPQCDAGLAEIAASQSGTDALFIRDFKVKLDEGNMKRPSPVARFQVYLKEGNTYRFNIADAIENESKGMLQLYSNNKLLNSTFNLEKDSNIYKFDFECKNTGNYQILFSFRENRKGCSAGIMSLVINDSTHKTLSNTLNNEYESLYIGIENELHIAATGIPEGSLDVSINNGNIEGNNGHYKVNVDRKGIATISVITRDKNGNIVEKDTVFFNVVDKPLPSASFNKRYGGHFSKSDLLLSNNLELINALENDYTKYEIIEFTVGSDYFSTLISYTSSLTFSQKSFIENLNSGDNLIFYNIKAKDSDGKTYNLNEIKFIIE